MQFQVHHHQEQATSGEEFASEYEENEVRLESAWGEKLRPISDFTHARDGDHLLIPFECDYCIHVKLKGVLPDMSSPTDKLLMCTIRRMVLDAFWSRESSTVKGNVRKAKRMIEMANTVGLPGPFRVSSPPLPFDHCGYQVAIIILLQSRKPGKYSTSYTQYDTIRSYRSTYSNFIRASSRNNNITQSLGDFNGNYQRIVEDECASLFFKRFMDGLRCRMGQVVKPNLALSIPLLLDLVNKIKYRLLCSQYEDDKHIISSVLTYITTSYIISLRGPEGFLLDLRGLNENWNSSNNYIVVSLIGRLKGERHDLTHLVPCVKVTSSGINFYEILKNHIFIKAQLNFTSGPAISDMNGRLLSAKIVDDVLHEELTNIFHDKPNLFPPKIDTAEKIPFNYQCFRTFRRTSTTRATEMKVSETDVNIVNRWKLRSDDKSKKPKSGMHQHYTELSLLVGPFLRYTKKM